MKKYTNEIPKEELKKLLPKSVITNEVYETINDLLNDGHGEMKETYTENMINYNHVLMNNRISPVNYVNAVKFCSWRIAGLTNKDAFIKTFPERYQHYLATGVTKQYIESYISTFASKTSVKQILEQAYIPDWIMHSNTRNNAIKKLIKLSETAESEKVQSDSSKALLDYLAPPITQRAEVSVNFAANDQADDLLKTLTELSRLQQQNIKGGLSTPKEVAESKIIQGEIVDNE